MTILSGMSAHDHKDVTLLLRRWKAGEHGAEQALIQAVYPTVKRLAAAQVRRNSAACTWGATELLNEAYEQLARQRQVDWGDRHHFFAIASTVLRRVVIDRLRHRSALKRGAGEPALGDEAFDQVVDEAATRLTSVDWLVLGEALEELEQADAAAATVVDMKVFMGLSVAQIGSLTGMSVATVGRKWRFARALLGSRLESP